MALRAAIPPQGLQRLARMRDGVRRLRGGGPAWLTLFTLGRLPAARTLAGRLAALRRPAPSPEDATGPGTHLRCEAGTATVLDRLRRDGICTGLSLAPATVVAIRRWAEARPCFGGPDWNTLIPPGDPEAARRRHGGPLLAGNHPDCDRDCPEIAALIRDPWLHRIAGAYLGARPLILDVRLWWSFPAVGADARALRRVAQDSFHFDLGDWRQLKAFFYITDVTAESGAHRYALGTHRGRPITDQLSPFSARSEGAVAALRGREAIVTLTGPAGTGFVEDPFGYHTGSSVRCGRRLILEVSFGITATTRRRAYPGPAC